MVAAFGAWAEKASGAQRQRHILAKVRGRWMHGALSAAFQGLQSLVAERSRNRLLLERTAQRMLHRQLGAAVNQWLWLWQQAQRVRRLLAKAKAR